MTYIQPGLTLVIGLLVICASSAAGPPRRRRRILLGVAAGLFAWSWFPVTLLTSATLERWYPETAIPAGEADALVVLSAGASEPSATQPLAALDTSSHRRARHAAWLYRHWKPMPVVASGGMVGAPGHRIAVSGVMKEVLVAGGVPAEMVWIEDRSSSTYENAVCSAAILREKGIRRIALVTEAYHMPRAERAFRKQGFEVVPAPCCFRSTSARMTWERWFPSVSALLRNEDSLHEWLGLLWYWVSGKI